MIQVHAVKKLKPLSQVLNEISFHEIDGSYIPNVYRMPMISKNIKDHFGKSYMVEWPGNSEIVTINGFIFHKSWFEDDFAPADENKKLDLTRLIDKQVYWRIKGVGDFSFEKITKVVNTTMGVMITIAGGYISESTRLMSEIDIAEITD